MSGYAPHGTDAPPGGRLPRYDLTGGTPAAGGTINVTNGQVFSQLVFSSDVTFQGTGTETITVDRCTGLATVQMTFRSCIPIVTDSRIHRPDDNGISLVTCPGGSLTRCLIEGALGDSLTLGSGCQNMTIQDSTIVPYNRLFQADPAGPHQDGVDMGKVDGITFQRITILGAHQSCLWFTLDFNADSDPPLADTSRNIIVDSCWLANFHSPLEADKDDGAFNGTRVWAHHFKNFPGPCSATPVAETLLASMYSGCAFTNNVIDPGCQKPLNPQRGYDAGSAGTDLGPRVVDGWTISGNVWMRDSTLHGGVVKGGACTLDLEARQCG